MVKPVSVNTTGRQLATQGVRWLLEKITGLKVFQTQYTALRSEMHSLSVSFRSPHLCSSPLLQVLHQSSEPW